MPGSFLSASFAVKNVDQDLNGLLKGNLDVTTLRKDSPVNKAYSND